MFRNLQWMSAAFVVTSHFYGTSAIRFRFTSDEYNGINRNGDGTRRPVVVRTYSNLEQAIAENAISRIYLGIPGASTQPKASPPAEKLPTKCSVRLFFRSRATKRRFQADAVDARRESGIIPVGDSVCPNRRVDWLSERSADFLPKTALFAGIRCSCRDSETGVVTIGRCSCRNSVAAGVAQLVERHVANVIVEGSSPFTRSSLLFSVLR